MKPIKLTTNDQVNLVEMLKVLFPEFIRIEILNKNIPYILFSKVKKGSILNLLRPDLVSEKIPIVELFLSELPRRLSVYQIGNDSNASVHWVNASVLVADNPSYLVSFFKEKFDKMEGIDKGEPYRVTLAKLGALENNIESGDYRVLRSVLKMMDLGAGKGNGMLKAIIKIDE